MSKSKTSLLLVPMEPAVPTETPPENSVFDFKVDRIQTEAGEELILLNRESLAPIFWPNVYVVSRYDKLNRSINTCDSVLRSIGAAHLWAWSYSIDFDTELRRGGFFSVEKMESLADFLSYTTKTQRKLAKRNKEGLNKLGLTRSKSQSIKLTQLKNDSDVVNRINWVAQYMKWHLDRRLGLVSREGRSTYELRHHGNSVLGALRESFDANNGIDETNLEGASVDTLRRINEALKPDATASLFQNDFNQARNYLMWLLFLDTGARRGEVHMAGVNDIDYAMKRFHIRFSKTYCRTVPISDAAADAFDNFIQQHWSKLPLSARKKGFIFTSTSGQHLNLRQINRVFEKIRTKLELSENVTPHTLRRSWNDNFSKQLDSMSESARPSVEQETIIRNRLQGWSLNSEMGAKYARRHIRKKADAIAEQAVQLIMEDK